jgi:hypothetical protein
MLRANDGLSASSVSCPVISWHQRTVRACRGATDALDELERRHASLDAHDIAEQPAEQADVGVERGILCVGISVGIVGRAGHGEMMAAARQPRPNALVPKVASRPGRP